ncbi:hypothetical protein SEA_LITTLEFELLA_48 [Gordonia phage LittleFella]|nr:hypothetical protein SEA_LITTLEFELLA_48 [Gordonia phage LittleFella]
MGEDDWLEAAYEDQQSQAMAWPDEGTDYLEDYYDGE